MSSVINYQNNNCISMWSLTSHCLLWAVMNKVYLFKSINYNMSNPNIQINCIYLLLKITIILHTINGYNLP